MKFDGDNTIQVSVLCLAYNHERYIRKTLEGFVHQRTNFKFEVLIHDDASTDQTASIIAKYVAKYPELIKPIYQSENQYSKGINIQRTYNYPRAKGKYLAWCEGDDYWSDEQKLQKQYDALEAHSECSICVHKVQCINEDGTKNKRVIPENFFGINVEGVLPDELVADGLWLKERSHYPFQTSSYFVRKTAINEIINGTLIFAANMTGDHVILRTALNNGHIFYINQIMSQYRLFSAGSYTSRRNVLTSYDRRSSYQNKVKGELLFDQYTSGRFHEWIIRFVSNQLVKDGAVNQNLLNDGLKKMNLTKKDVLTYCSFENKMKFYLSVYFHPVYEKLKKVYLYFRKHLDVS